MTQHALHLTAAVTHENDWYVARCLQVEVASQGATIEEALDNLREALELYFEDEPAPEACDDVPFGRSSAAPADVPWKVMADRLDLVAS
ncbi:type II toxin-antitoxin system HicB family antitoxin [Streptantibioticus rubrisoli]|uniref:Type II toxin-antitoxin system HicB family antitoxin n=1 Tax=Streptantibioticus rubrisoli TaxID=1387313 RepID=A0ABT1PJE2_9ACTN|nr:type II toxin-antitoxin system HicB family antitoxin [Streptantibioticus rubrisoli]MCQ4045491.1 type II toxin-antitoxin system HicB family antitoxin [Streptantibioticus rubrisoli]